MARVCTKKQIVIPRNVLVKFAIILLLGSIYSFPDKSQANYVVRILFIGIMIIHYFGKRVIIKQKYIAWVLLFSLSCLVSILFSYDTKISLATFMLTIQAIGISSLIYIWLFDTKEYRFFILTNALSIIPFIFRAYLYYSSTIWGLRRYSYLFGVNTNSWGFRLSLSVFFSISYYYYTNRKIVKAGMIFIAISSIVLILITGSRRALILAVAALGGLLLGYNVSNSKKIKITVLLIAVFGGLCYALTTIPSFYTIIGSRFINMYETNTILDSSRKEMIETGLQLFGKRPFTGWGLGTFRDVSGLDHPYCHNNYVELLFATGFFGFSVYYSRIFWVIKKAISVRYDKKKFASLIVMIVYVLVSGYVTVDYTSLITQILIVFMLSISDLNQESFYHIVEYGIKEGH